MPKKYNTGRPEWDKEHIQALRRHLGLTQREMAARMGTRQQTISEWETGMYQPRGASATLLFLIAENADFQYNARENDLKIESPGSISYREKAGGHSLKLKG
jgi:DNA-binding XRE family transcriptional regulator